MEEQFSLWYAIQSLFYRVRRFIGNLRYEQCLRRSHYEFTWLPTGGNYVQFGYEFNPLVDSDARSYVSFGGLQLFSLYLYLPISVNAWLMKRTKYFRSFRFTIGGEYIYISRGKTLKYDHMHELSKTKFIDWPWNWTFVAQYYYSPDLVQNMKVVEVGGALSRAECPEEWKIKQPYTYEYKSSKFVNGEIVPHVERQVTEATFFVTERVWKRKCFPFIKLRRRVIDVKFADEMGPERGSWKGGVIGTSHEMRRGEMPTDTLLRMMAERRF